MPMERLFTAGSPSSIKDGVVIRLVEEDRPALQTSLRRIEALGVAGAVQSAASGDFSATLKQTVTLYPKSKRGTTRVVLVGLGKRKELTTERMRRACAQGAKRARGLKADAFTIILPRSIRTTEMIVAAFEGADLATYSYDAYKSKEKGQPEVRRISVFSEDTRLRKTGSRARDIAECIILGTRFARNLANAPGNVLYPETLADAAAAGGKECGFAVTVLDEHEIEAAGMGGVVAVGRGSVRPPRFLILEHGPSDKQPVVLVGKGVTFDTGGISIKPSAGMGEMKMDMAGAAAVLGTFEAIARLRLPIHVIGLVPAVENMPGGGAQRPGDIITHLSGKTSEVDNTDAEGRLILADALAYASRYKPSAVIDLATLTGAVVVALGHVAAGMMGTDDDVMEELTRAGERTFERVWQLPLFEEYARLIRSDVADVKNVGGRWAGPITAAMFLKQHIGKYPWVHLDIAGTAMLEEVGDYTQRGGSGFGVRLLTEFLRRRASKRND